MTEVEDKRDKDEPDLTLLELKPKLLELAAVLDLELFDELELNEEVVSEELELIVWLIAEPATRLDCANELVATAELVTTTELFRLLIELAVLASEEAGEGGTPPGCNSTELIADAVVLSAEFPSNTAVELTVPATTGFGANELDGESLEPSPAPPPQAVNQTVDTNNRPNLKNLNDTETLTG